MFLQGILYEAKKFFGGVKRVACTFCAGLLGREHMTLDEYVRMRGRGTLTDLCKAADVSYTTLHKIKGGMRLKRWDIAKRISEATLGEVSVAELCEEPSAKEVTEGWRCRLCGNVVPGPRPP